MAAKQILVLGGGFAGLWSALAAARKLEELAIGRNEVAVTLVNRDAFHGIRVRNYEADLAAARVPLDDVLGPVGVDRVQATVTGVFPSTQTIGLQGADGARTLPYDRLIFALGSQLLRPPVPGLAEWAFDVDTYDSACRLNAHVDSLPSRAESPGLLTVVVVGAGLTGIEVAMELPGKLRTALDRAGSKRSFRVILVDHHERVGSDMGAEAQPVIEQALAAIGVGTRLGVSVAAIDDEGVTLSSGERIPSQTLVWCAGMRANPLTQAFAVARDRLGRLPVDDYLRVSGVPDVFACGDGASAVINEGHASVMSCQHARPMGRFAGHNAVCDLLGLPMLPLHVDWYVTVLDLGPENAVYTEGWDRHVVATGPVAKRTKQTINSERIYPPATRDRGDILGAAAPVVERPPTYGR